MDNLVLYEFNKKFGKYEICGMVHTVPSAKGQLLLFGVDAVDGAEAFRYKSCGHSPWSCESDPLP